jgi:non-heme chloroperoxidase
VLPLPVSTQRASFRVLSNPGNRRRAVMLTEEQVRYACTNALTVQEAHELYATYPVPGAGLPLFQAAFANLNPRSETKVDSRNPRRGPLLIMVGQRDHTAPWAIANASFKKQRRNRGVTEISQVPGRGHSLVFDSGWEQVAQLALEFAARHAPC